MIEMEPIESNVDLGSLAKFRSTEEREERMVRSNLTYIRYILMQTPTSLRDSFIESYTIDLKYLSNSL